MRYQTVIFDLDGTLLDTLEDLTSAVNHALRQCSYPEHSMEEIRSYVGNGIGLLITRALPGAADGDPEAYSQTFQAFSEYYARHNNDATAPYPGIPELLQRLKAAGCRLAVVSNKNDPNVKALCQLYFSDTIDHAVGECPGVRRKPAPDTVLRVMEALNADAKTTLYVGDSDVDLETAQNAEVDCAAVLWGFRSEEQLRAAGATHLFSSPKGLADWILGE